MKALWVLLLVGATTAVAADKAPVRVAVSGLAGVNVPSEALGFYAEHLALNLRSAGLQVTTAREMAAVIGFERQKQLLGCGEAETSCIAELASALGVDAIVVGDVARFGDTYQLNFKALGARDAKVLAARSSRVTGDVATLDAVAADALQLARGLLERLGREVPPEVLARTNASADSLRTWAWVPLGAGLVSAGVGGLMLGLAGSDHAALTATAGAPLTEAEATALRTGGTTKQTVGGVLIAVGATSMVAAGAMFLFGGPKSTTTVAVTPLFNSSGAVVTWSGVLP